MSRSSRHESIVTGRLRQRTYEARHGLHSSRVRWSFWSGQSR